MKLADALAYAANQPVTMRCAHCPWTWEGLLEDGRKEHEQHRIQAHNIRVVQKRKRSSRSPFRSDKPLHANIEAARKEGAARWAGKGEP